MEEQRFSLIIRLMGYGNPMNSATLRNLGQECVTCQPRGSRETQTHGLCQCGYIAAFNNSRDAPRLGEYGNSTRLSLSLDTTDAMVEVGNLQGWTALHAQLQQQV